MFKCDSCGTQVPPNTPEHKVRIFRDLLNAEGYKRRSEIAKELKVCEECFKKSGQKEDQ